MIYIQRYPIGDGIERDSPEKVEKSLLIECRDGRKHNRGTYREKIMLRVRYTSLAAR
jgi:hypothetical protein